MNDDCFCRRMPDGEWVICARHVREAGRRFLDELNHQHSRRKTTEETT